MDLSWIETVQTGGLVGALVLFLYGFKAGWWVNGSHYQERVDELKTYQQNLKAAQENYKTELQETRAQLDTYRDRIEADVIPLMARTADALIRFASERRADGGP